MTLISCGVSGSFELVLAFSRIAGAADLCRAVFAYTSEMCFDLGAYSFD